MDKYELASQLKNAKPVCKDIFIQQKCSGKSVLDLGCIRHNAEYALKDPNWLHQKIRTVASEVVGIDYLPEEIEKLNARGYEIVFGDVTKPLLITKKFDIIVAGDLIEHLTSFEGFFENCTRCLKPGGELIITTPNPFYSGEFHFVSFNQNYLINPEHTCWIDPQALSQLARRFGYVIGEIYFLKDPWCLKDIIWESKSNQYDIINGNWTNESLRYKIIRKIGGNIFSLLYWPIKLCTAHTDLVRYSDYLAVLKLE